MEEKNHQEYEKIDISDSYVYSTLLPSRHYPDGFNQEDHPLYCVMIDDEVLKTPNGNPIYHENQRGIRELAAEIDYLDELNVRKISLYNLCCTQIDFYPEGKFNISIEALQLSVSNDPVLQTCAGPEVIAQMKYFKTIEDYLLENGINYPHLPQIPVEAPWGDENLEKIVQLILESVESFNNHQITVFITATHIFNSPVLAMMLVKALITAKVFAVLYLTGLALNSKVWGDIDREEEKEALRDITADADCMLRYLNHFSITLSEMHKLIQAGESKELEFKSTLRWNLHADRKDQAIEHSVLKTIIAYLNTDGGTLLVGVEDNGNVIGISKDGFKNDDKFLLHFANMINRSIGKKYSDLIKWKLVTVDKNKVLRVDCLPSTEPVFLKFKNQEEFYIRTGPSSIQLSPSEILGYTNRRFQMHN